MPITTNLVNKTTLKIFKSQLDEMHEAFIKEQDKHIDKNIKDAVNGIEYIDIKDITKPSYQCYLIQEADEVVGYIVLAKTKKDDVLSLQQLYILPKSRKKGTAGIVLESLFKKLKEQKYKVLETSIPSNDRTSYKLLKKYEFESYISSMYKKL